MEKDTNIIDVIFRKYKDNGFILALFPYEISHSNYVVCYEHVGQHGSADYNHCISRLTTPATESEYKDLKKELESIGYNLNVVKRRNYDKYLKEYKYRNCNLQKH